MRYVQFTRFFAVAVAVGVANADGEYHHGERFERAGQETSGRRRSLGWVGYGGSRKRVVEDNECLGVQTTNVC